MANPEPGTNLTPLEFDIMSILWEIAPASVREVQEHPSLSARSLAYNTVQTMLNILVRKKKARRRKRGRSFFYEPTISKTEVASSAVRDLLDRVFEGNAERLLLSLLETRELSTEKIAELRDLLDKEAADEHS